MVQLAVDILKLMMNGLKKNSSYDIVSWCILCFFKHWLSFDNCIWMIDSIWIGLDSRRGWQAAREDGIECRGGVASVLGILAASLKVKSIAKVAKPWYVIWCASEDNVDKAVLIMQRFGDVPLWNIGQLSRYTRCDFQIESLDTFACGVCVCVCFFVGLLAWASKRSCFCFIFHGFLLHQSSTMARLHNLHTERRDFWISWSQHVATWQLPAEIGGVNVLNSEDGWLEIATWLWSFVTFADEMIPYLDWVLGLMCSFNERLIAWKFCHMLRRTGMCVQLKRLWRKFQTVGCRIHAETVAWLFFHTCGSRLGSGGCKQLSIHDLPWDHVDVFVLYDWRVKRGYKPI